MAKRRRMARHTRHRGAFRRYTLYYMLALLLLLGTALLLCMTVFFRVEGISVTGCTVYPESEVLAASGISRGDNLLRLHTGDIAASLRDKYPYFESVTVRRVLPDAVRIDVTEATQTAALRTGDGTCDLLSESGRALEIGEPVCPETLIPADGFNLVTDAKGRDADAEAPLTAGAQLAESERTRYEALLQVLAALRENGLYDKISIIDMGDLFDIRLLYDGRVAVYAGGTADLDYKLRFAALAIEENVGEEFVGTLDVSQKPTARLRETDIYAQDAWPFASDLLAEYERKIVRETPWLEIEAESADTAAESAADTGSIADTAEPAPTEEPETSPAAGEYTDTDETEEAGDTGDLPEDAPEDDE